jgi:hypothetical protein
MRGKILILLIDTTSRPYLTGNPQFFGWGMTQSGAFFRDIGEGSSMPLV